MCISVQNSPSIIAAAIPLYPLILYPIATNSPQSVSSPNATRNQLLAISNHQYVIVALISGDISITIACFNVIVVTAAFSIPAITMKVTNIIVDIAPINKVFRKTLIFSWVGLNISVTFLTSSSASLRCKAYMKNAVNIPIKP